MEQSNFYSYLRAFLVFLTLIVIIPYAIKLYANKYEDAINQIMETQVLMPIASRNPEILDIPLCEFAIATSHNSYLNGFQHLTYSSTEGIKNSLEKGARAIELDIGMINNNIWVYHGNSSIYTSSLLSVDDAFDTILEYGFKTSDPLLLFIEMHEVENVKLNKMLRNAIIDKFGFRNRRYNAVMNEGETDPLRLFDTPIKFLLNQIMICGTITNDQTLYDVFESDINFSNVSDTSIKSIRTNPKNKLYRIYQHGSIASVYSFNINASKFHNREYGIVAMNYQTSDKNMYEYIQLFKEYSFIPMAEL